MEVSERICRYLSACPPAVSGQRGHDRTYAVACSLYQGFDLSESEVLHYLSLWNQRCQPPWDEGELARKANQATLAQHTKKRGYLLGDNGFSPEDYKCHAFPPKQQKVEAPKLDPSTEIEKFINGFRCSEADLMEASPVRPSEDWTQDGSLLVSTLYQEQDRVNFVTQFKLSNMQNGLTKPVPSGYGTTMVRDELVAHWELNGMPQSEAGGWFRFNPIDGQGIADKNVTAFRFILLEFDTIPLDLQISLLCKLPLPIAAILTSGGKSVHAWCRADCNDAADYKTTAERLLNTLERFGLDPKNKNPSRLSRLVGVVRTLGAADDGRQRLLYLNPEPEMRAIL